LLVSGRKAGYTPSSWTNVAAALSAFDLPPVSKVMRRAKPVYRPELNTPPEAL
jgi:hypothetical protein